MKPHQQLLHLHRTMRIAGTLVPAAKREAWREEWVAELTYLLGESPQAAQQCANGLFADAFAMRQISVINRWRAIDWRSPELCMRSLFGIFALLSAVGMAQPQLRHVVFSRWGAVTSAVFLMLAVFTVPSTVVVSRYGACDAYEGDAASTRQRAARWAFLASKLVLVVLCSYLLAVELTHPLYKVADWLADFFLITSGMLFNVISIGWAFNDQRERCPTCMRLLHSPARMGQPSWSLLDSNATEEMCDQGHGLLHQPQWQTSWYNNSRWLQLDRTWRGLFRP
jgi:hypothetical protein